MRLASLAIAAALIAPALIASTLPTAAGAQMVSGPAELKKYNVTIRRFDPAQGPQGGTDFVLPVDSPDEEHAIASTIANAASFSRKAEGGRALPVAFMAVRVSLR